VPVFSELKPEQLTLCDATTGKFFTLKQDNDHLEYRDPTGALVQRVDNIESGIEANRPAAGVKNRWYYATDTHRLWLDDGTTWNEVAPGICECGFSAYLSAAQTIPSATFTKVEFDIESFDLGADYDNTTNYRFTAPFTGYYVFNTQVVMNGAAAYHIFRTRLYKNGVSFVDIVYEVDVNARIALPLSHIMYLSANDYIEVFAFQNTGVDRSIIPDEKCTHFEGYFLSY